jgi:hypothetical protein
LYRYLDLTGRKKALFHHAIGNRMFLQNVDTHLSKYTTHHTTPQHATPQHTTTRHTTPHHTQLKTAILYILSPSDTALLTEISHLFK